MLQVRPKTVELRIFQKRYSIHLQNKGQKAVAFKVRSTNVKNYSIDPNAGFLRPATSLVLTLLLQIHDPFQAKVQVIYAQLVDYSYSFEQAWTKITELKLPIYSEIIQVQLPPEKQQPEEVNRHEFHPLRHTESVIRSSRIHLGNQIRQSSLNLTPSKRGPSMIILPVIKEDQQFKDLLVANTGIKNMKHMEQIMDHFEKERQRHFDAEEREELLYQLEELNSKLKKEVSRAERLKQQLNITEGKLKENNKQRMKVQGTKPIGVICDEHHISFTGLALLALAAFILGYALALQN